LAINKDPVLWDTPAIDTILELEGHAAVVLAIRALGDTPVFNTILELEGHTPVFLVFA
jgi:hypothetical protein